VIDKDYDYFANRNKIELPSIKRPNLNVGDDEFDNWVNDQENNVTKHKSQSIKFYDSPNNIKINEKVIKQV